MPGHRTPKLDTQSRRVDNSFVNTYDEPSTDASLLSRARAGCDEDWRVLVQIYGPIVYRWMRRCGQQSSDAADLMQETFFAASRAIHRFDARRESGSFRAWLWTIARNKLRDRQRDYKRHPGLHDARGGSDNLRILGDLTAPNNLPPEPPSSVEDDSRLAQSRTLEWLRASFEPRAWQMFWETTIESRDPQEVADELGVSRWAVYKSRARVLQKLRETLAGTETK